MSNNIMLEDQEEQQKPKFVYSGGGVTDYDYSVIETYLNDINDMIDFSKTKDYKYYIYDSETKEMILSLKTEKDRIEKELIAQYITPHKNTRDGISGEEAISYIQESGNLNKCMIDVYYRRDSVNIRELKYDDFKQIFSDEISEMQNGNVTQDLIYRIVIKMAFLETGGTVPIMIGVLMEGESIEFAEIMFSQYKRYFNNEIVTNATKYFRKNTSHEFRSKLRPYVYKNRQNKLFTRKERNGIIKGNKGDKKGDKKGERKNYRGFSYMGVGELDPPRKIKIVNLAKYVDNCNFDYRFGSLHRFIYRLGGTYGRKGNCKELYQMANRFFYDKEIYKYRGIMGEWHRGWIYLILCYEVKDICWLTLVIMVGVGKLLEFELMICYQYCAEHYLIIVTVMLHWRENI